MKHCFGQTIIDYSDCSKIQIAKITFRGRNSIISQHEGAAKSLVLQQNLLKPNMFFLIVTICSSCINVFIVSLENNSFIQSCFRAQWADKLINKFQMHVYSSRNQNVTIGIVEDIFWMNNLPLIYTYPLAQTSTKGREPEASPFNHNF